MIDEITLRENIHRELEVELKKFQKLLEIKSNKAIAEVQLEAVVAKMTQGVYLDLFEVKVKEKEDELINNFQAAIKKLSLMLDQVYG